MTLLKEDEVALLSHVAEIKRIFASLPSTESSDQGSSFVVTSALKGEGKTTITALLAAAACRQTNREILAIDFNWHEPTLHEIFGLGRRFDVRQFREESKVRTQALSSGLEGLDILTAPSTEVSDSVITLSEAIVTQSRREYDLIFLDTSAIFPTNRYMVDPVVMARMATGVILVVLATMTPRGVVKKTLTNLETAGSLVVGSVVNQWKNPTASRLE